MHYTLHQLHVFLKVSNTLSITKAAKELNLSQPAVSIQLKNFQDQFEIPLTEVIGKKLYVTDFGKEIAVAAENILNEVYAINYKTLLFKGQISGRLKISIVSTGKYLLPYFLSDYLNSNKGVELIMDVTNKLKVVDSLVKNEVDFSLISVLPSGTKLSNLEIMPNLLVLVCNQEIYNSLPIKSNKILELYPFIFRENGSATRMESELYFKNNQLKISKKFELTSNEAVKQAVIAGLGISIMPLIGLKNEIENGQIKIIRLPDFPITSKWQLVWLKEKQMSPVAAAFLEHIKKNKDQIIEKQFAWQKKIKK